MQPEKTNPVNSDIGKGRGLPSDIRGFITRVQRRLNRMVVIRSAVRALFVCAASAVLVCLYYVLQGYAVSASPLAYLAILFSLCWIIFYLFSRCSFVDATVFADRTFNLQDSLQSACEFVHENTLSAFKHLDIENTSRRVNGINPADFKQSLSSRLLILTLLLCCSVLLLAAIPQSESVTRKLQEIERVAKASTEAAEQMKEQLEEEEKKLDEQTRESLKETRIPQKIAELGSREDMKDSLRDYAKLEKEMHEVAQKNDPAAEKAFFRELSKTLLQQKQTAGLGRELSKGDYKKAVKEMNSYKFNKEMSSSQLRKQADRLSKLSKAMEKSLSSSQKIGKNSKLAQNIKSLSQSLCQISKSKDCKSGKCMKACESANKSLATLCRSMSQLPARQKLSTMMQRLLARSGQCQSLLRGNKNGGMCNKPSDSPSNNWGTGNAGNFNNKLEAKMMEKTLQLAGVMGDGESEKNISSAASGNGGASLFVENRKRQFRRSAENFVMREDVPGEYKRGVKKYFNSINLGLDNEEK